MITNFGICLGNSFLVGCNFKSRDYFQHFFQLKVVISQRKKEKCFQITTTTKEIVHFHEKKILLVKLLLSIAFASHDSLTTATPPFQPTTNNATSKHLSALKSFISNSRAFDCREPLPIDGQKRNENPPPTNLPFMKSKIW